MEPMLELIHSIVQSHQDGLALSRVVELGLRGKCICAEPERYRKAFRCPVHQDRLDRQDGNVMEHSISECEESDCEICRWYYQSEQADQADD